MIPTKQTEKRTFSCLRRHLLLALALAMPMVSRADVTTNHADAYLLTLQQTPGAIDALRALAGYSFPQSGPLSQSSPEYVTLISLLFDSNGAHTAAWDFPQVAAQGVVSANTYLQALRSTGGLSALQSLTGLSLPSSGILSGRQIDQLFSLMYDAQGNKTAAFSKPTEVASALTTANRYLGELRSTPGALAALSRLLGKSLPTAGALSGSQVDTLIGLLYKSDGSHQDAVWNNPHESAAALAQSDKVLTELRANPESLTALSELLNKQLPSSGILNQAQIDTLISLLYKSDGSHQDSFWNNPAEAALALVQGNKVLKAFRSQPQSLAALEALVGKILPALGILNETQMDSLLGLLFKGDGSRQVAFWANDLNEAVAAVTQGNVVLTAFRGNPSALAALEALTGQKLPSSGLLNASQMDVLLGLLYKSDGTHQTALWINPPTEAIAALSQAQKVLTAFRASPAALTALEELTGKKLPASGILDASQLDVLLGLLYRSDGSRQPTMWATSLSEATAALAQANKLLKALRANPAALAALEEMVGTKIPLQGMLNETQLNALLGLLYKADGSRQATLWAEDLTQAVDTLVKANNYLKALRATPGALQALLELTGQSLPATGTLSDKEIEILIGLLFNPDGTPAPASFFPQEAAEALAMANAYMKALRGTPGALQALKDLTGIVLPASGLLNADEMHNLVGQLYTKFGARQASIWNNPIEAAKALAQANLVLKTLQANSEALVALQELVGISLPGTARILTETEIDALLGMLYKEDGTRQAALWASDPTESALALIQGNRYLKAIRAEQGAREALLSLTGKSLPVLGRLDQKQMDVLLGLLYQKDGTRQQAVWKDPALAAKGLTKAQNFLEELRNKGVYKELNELTGATLPLTGILDEAQLDFLFKQLYNASGEPTQAYNSPETAVDAIHHAYDYWNKLRNTSGGLQALRDLVGIDLPASGPLGTTPATVQEKMEQLVGMLFDAKEQPTEAYKNPQNAVEVLIHGKALLDALRSTPGALDGFREVTGKSLPRSGPLTEDQLYYLMLQLFKSDGKSHTEAWDNPSSAAQKLAQQSSKSILGPLLVALVGGVAAGFVVAGFAGAPAGILSGLAVGGALAAFGVQRVRSQQNAIRTTPSTNAATNSLAPTPSVLPLPTIAPLGVPAPRSSLAISPAVRLPQGQRTTDLVTVTPGSRIVGATAPNLAYEPLFIPDPNRPGESLKTPSGQRAILDQFRWLSNAQSPNARPAASREALRYGAASNKGVGVVAPDQNSR